jgi:hypothetical protein
MAGAFDREFSNHAKGQELRPLRDRLATVSDRWQHKVVGLVLQHFDLVSRQTAIKNRRGVSNLRFDDFYAEFPSFPAWLHCAKVPYVHRTTLADLAKPTKTPIWRAFELAESVASFDRPAVLVFEWLKVWPVACFHAIDPEVEHGGDGLSVKIVEKSEILTLQSFPQFLSSLRWSP